MGKKRKAVFFDRDGIVNMRAVKDYIKSEEEFQFLPDFIDFFGKLIGSEYLTFLITNQQGVGKGIMTDKQLQKVLSFMQNKLKIITGKCFDDIFYCTDLAESGSFYRKPNPGMILEAIEKWDLDTENSWMIGDSPSDAAAGRKAGIKTILVGDFIKEEFPDADYIIKDLFVIDESVPILC